MEKVNKIIVNKTFKIKYEKLVKLEENREFCNHTIEHFLDVARIAYILNLEEGLGIRKDLIYSAAILHDIGRVDEYETCISHHTAGKNIAREILESIDGYSKDDIDIIVSAVNEHRSSYTDRSVLGELLYRSDKLSRNCMFCKAIDKCNWPDEKKNSFIKI